MVVEQIKVKAVYEHHSTFDIVIGTKIIIYTPDKQVLSIEEEEKIKEFFKNLRA